MGLRRERIIIGLTGPFGAGCTKVVGNMIFHEKMGLPVYSLSNKVKKEYQNVKKNYGDIVRRLTRAAKEYFNREFGDGWEIDISEYTDVIKKNRQDKNNRIVYQNIGNYLRLEYGEDFLAKDIIDEIEGKYQLVDDYVEDIKNNGFKGIEKVKVVEDFMRIINNLRLPNEITKYLGDTLKQNVTDIEDKKLLEIISFISDKLHELPIIIDSIRNIYEIIYLRRFSNFYLLSLNADKKVRWERTKEEYSSNEELFKKLEQRDNEESIKVYRNGYKGLYEKLFLPFGQNVSECSQMSDFCINNNHNYKMEANIHKVFVNKIGEYIELIQKPWSRPPNEDELMMALAYNLKSKSICKQRQVGAVITDPTKKRVLSSGINDYPINIKPCVEKYIKGCYRRCNEDTSDNRYIPGLEKCRALHAEENAILQVAKLGGMSLKEAILYVTTFPCTLCAKKIVEVGIKNVYYNEPYEHDPSREILKEGGVELHQFEGVTARSFNRLFERRLS